MYINTTATDIIVPFHKHTRWQLYIWTQFLIVAFFLDASSKDMENLLEH